MSAVPSLWHYFLRVRNPGSWTGVRAPLVVMDYPVREELAQMLLAEWDDEIQTLPATRSHQTFTIGARGGVPHRRWKYFESESPECVVQFRRKDCVPVMD